MDEGMSNAALTKRSMRQGEVIDRLAADLGLARSEIALLREQMGLMEKRVAELEDRQDTLSV